MVATKIIFKFDDRFNLAKKISCTIKNTSNYFRVKKLKNRIF